MKGRGKLRLIGKVTIITALFLLSALTVISAVQAKETHPHKKIAPLNLKMLTGEVMVFYSKGYKNRAAFLQGLTTGAARYLGKSEILGVKVDLGLAVLSAEDWAKFSKLPYGMSHVLANPHTAVLPASKLSLISLGIIKSKERFPQKNKELLKELGLSFEDAASLFVDFIGFHEMGHLYGSAYGASTWPQTKWLEEFIASYLAYTFMKEKRPKLAKLWDTMNDALTKIYTPKHTNLADFERLYIGVGNENYGWYQGRFNKMVARVYKKMGISFIHMLRQSLRKNPKPLPKDPFRLKELDTIFPGFLNWATGTDGNLH